MSRTAAGTAPHPGDRRRISLRATVGLALLAGLAGVTLAACSGGGGAGPGFTVTPTTARPGVVISSERSPVGRVLATAGGRTLYDFAPDTPTSSACVSSLCTTLWPPLIVQAVPEVGPGLDQSLAGTIRRSDGQLQATYAGHPLYTWIGDPLPGMITGQALLNAGGYWYVVGVAGNQIDTAFTVGRAAVRR